MDSPNKPLPTKEQLQASAYRLLSKMVKADGGKQPSEEALVIAARLLGARAWRKLDSQLVPPSPP